MATTLLHVGVGRIAGMRLEVDEHQSSILAIVCTLIIEYSEDRFCPVDVGNIAEPRISLCYLCLFYAFRCVTFRFQILQPIDPGRYTVAQVVVYPQTGIRAEVQAIDR